MLDRKDPAAVPERAYAWIDRAYQAFLDVHPEIPDRWLIEQTLYTGAQRRALLDELSIPDHARVLDVGTGFGAIALDLAHSRPIDVTAVDVALDKIVAAHTVAGSAWVALGREMPGRLAFGAADVYRLPYRPGAFDFVLARLLFQHLPDPRAALAEIRGVLRPGGTACIVAIDDGLTISYPESDAYRRLYAAFTELQRRAGGDREIGRKLGSYLHEAGFGDVSTRVRMQSSFERSSADDLAQRLLLRRFEVRRAEIVAAGLLGDDEFEELIHALERDANGWQFVANGLVIVTGTTPS